MDNKSQLLQTALDRGLITLDQYQKGKYKLESSTENDLSVSKRKMLDLALERGLIKDEDYQKGLSKLGNEKSKVEEIPTDPYSQRREKALKKVEGLPQFAKDIYAQYLYPPRKKLEEEQQGIAKNIRNIATLPGAVADLPLLPVNLGLGLAGKQTYVPSQMIGEAIDTATSGYTKPETNMEKVNEAVMQSVLPMGALGKLGSKLAQQGSKWLSKPGEFLQSSNVLTPTNVAATAAGSAGTQQYMNVNPEGGPVGALGVGLLSSLAGGKLGKNIDVLTNPSAAAARILSVSPNKVSNQLKSPSGKYIPSTLADISESDNINMIQHALSKTPFLGKFVKSARDVALEAERQNLNKIGLENVLPSDEAGILAKIGGKKYQNIIDTESAEKLAQIEKGLQPHAKPYPYHSLESKLNKIEKKDAKKRELIEYYTGQTEKQLKNKPINLVPFPETKNFIGRTLMKADMPESQILELDNKFGKIVEDLDDLSKVYRREGVPYKSLESIRKRIDDTISTWGQVGNITEGKMKQLRGHIKNDIGNYLGSKDAGLKKVWDERNELLHEFIKTEQPHLTGIKNLAEKGDLTAITKDLVQNLKNSGKKVSTIIKGLNEKQKESLGFSFLNEMGKKAEDADFDMFTFAKSYKGLKGNGKSVFKDLFNEENSKNIDRLTKRLENIQEASSYAKSSPTGYINKFYHVLRHPIKSIGGTAGSILALKLYTNPKFLNWVSQGSHMRTDAKMGHHFQKLKKMDLGSKVMNQQIRDLYNRFENEEGTEPKKKTLSITPQKGKESKAEFIEE